VALWPALAIVDRIDPDRRDDTWPLLATNPRMRSRDRDPPIFTRLSARRSGSP
jgi:hypothetical protein